MTGLQCNKFKGDKGKIILEKALLAKAKMLDKYLVEEQLNAFLADILGIPIRDILWIAICIPISKYLQETQQATIQDTNLQAQQDSLILSVIEEMSEQMINHELLVYVQDTCPNAITPSSKKVAITPMNKVKKVRFAEPLTSSSNIKQVVPDCTLGIWTPALPPTPRMYRNNGQGIALSALELFSAHDFYQLLSVYFWVTVRSVNEQIARILGLNGDFLLGNVVISRVILR
ncbi:hypothetical protein Tco_1362657 [Tanacetum coccineum]